MESFAIIVRRYFSIDYEKIIIARFQTFSNSIGLQNKVGKNNEILFTTRFSTTFGTIFSTIFENIKN